MADGREAEEGEPVVDDAGAATLARAALDLARRFAAGATMWCVSPPSPEHARHVAVEFVHPVVMGTRALPAVSVDASATAGLRLVSRPGDVLVAVGPATGTPPAGAGSAPLADLATRARVWGLTTVWIGAGPPPPPSAADHVVFVDRPFPVARHDGSLVLCYHLLWELTHVCFEHPGLLAPDRGPSPGDGAHCVTCADEGRPAEVVHAGARDATVRSAAGLETVDASLVAPVRDGDLLLVHAGAALARWEP